MPPQKNKERLQNTPQPQTTSFQCVGTLCWTSRKTIGTILIQLDANELRGILQSSQERSDCRIPERLQNTPQPQTTSFQCVGTLCWTSRKTIGTILIQLDANELRGILQSSQEQYYFSKVWLSLSIEWYFLFKCHSKPGVSNRTKFQSN